MYLKTGVMKVIIKYGTFSSRFTCIWQIILK